MSSQRPPTRQNACFLDRSHGQTIQKSNCPVARKHTLDIASVTLRTRPGSGAVQEVEVASIRPATAQYIRFRTSPSMRPTVPQDLQWSPAGEFQNNDEPFYRISDRDSTKLLYLQFNTVYSESDVDAFSDLSIQGLADSLRTLAASLPFSTKPCSSTWTCRHGPAEDASIHSTTERPASSLSTLPSKIPPPLPSSLARKCNISFNLCVLTGDVAKAAFARPSRTAPARSGFECSPTTVLPPDA